MFSKVDGAIADAVARKKQRDEISDEYCDAATIGYVRGLKDVGVKDQDIIFALNRAILTLQYAEWQKRKDANNV